MGKEKQKQSTTPHVVCDLTCYHFLISAQNKALLQNKFWCSSLLIWILCVSSGKTISWFSKPCCFSLPWTISYSHYHQDKSHFPAKTELNIHYLFFTSWRKVKCFEISHSFTESLIKRLIYRKHVWANFCLSHHNEKLLDDSSSLQDFGIRNNSKVLFGFLYSLSFLPQRTSSTHVCLDLRNVLPNCRCSLFLASSQRLLRGIQRGRNIVSFMASANVFE